MIKGKTRKIAGIVAVVLAVGGGAYLTGAKALGTCDGKAKRAAMTAGDRTTCEKVHASAMASTNGSCDAKARRAAMASSACDAKAQNAVLTDADACPYLKAHAAKASTKQSDCPEGTCPMEDGAKGAQKGAPKKAEAKGVMASVVPSPASSR